MLHITLFNPTFRIDARAVRTSPTQGDRSSLSWLVQLAELSISSSSENFEHFTCWKEKKTKKKHYIPHKINNSKAGSTDGQHTSSISWRASVSNISSLESNARVAAKLSRGSFSMAEQASHTHPVIFSWGPLSDLKSWSVHESLGGKVVQNLMAMVTIKNKSLLQKKKNLTLFLRNKPWYIRF